MSNQRDVFDINLAKSALNYHMIVLFWSNLKSIEKTFHGNLTFFHLFKSINSDIRKPKLYMYIGLLASIYVTIM